MLFHRGMSGIFDHTLLCVFLLLFIVNFPEMSKGGRIDNAIDGAFVRVSTREQ